MRYFHHAGEIYRDGDVIPAGADELISRLGEVYWRARRAGHAIDPDAIERAIVRPEQLDEMIIGANRSKRNQILSDSDWTQIPDSSIAHLPDLVAAWSAYRQQLHALDLLAPVWPVPPGGAA